MNKNHVKNQMSDYDEEYFERGLMTGKSGYANFSWMPELTLRMAHYFITDIPIQKGMKVLDYGCAKGYIVKALRLLGIESYGVDVSDYAISKVENEYIKYCKHIKGSDDPLLFEQKYDWLISKDVFEHMSEQQIIELLRRSKSQVSKMFIVVPLSEDDTSGKYIIPEYDKDITHVIAKSANWWKNLFETNGWKVIEESRSFNGCKENWTTTFPDGNGFFKLKNMQD